MAARLTTLSVSLPSIRDVGHRNPASPVEHPPFQNSESRWEGDLRHKPRTFLVHRRCWIHSTLYSALAQTWTPGDARDCRNRWIGNTWQSDMRVLRRQGLKVWFQWVIGIVILLYTSITAALYGAFPSLHLSPYLFISTRILLQAAGGQEISNDLECTCSIECEI